MVVGQVQSVGQPLQNQQKGQVQMVPMQHQQMGQVQMAPVIVVQPNGVGAGGAGGIVAVQPIQPLMATTPMPVQSGMQQQPTLLPTPLPIPVAK